MVTWDEILTEVKNEYDLNDEVFTSDEELIAWANEAIEDIEKEIHAIRPKYFQAEAYLPVVAGESLISLPTDIYAFKINHLHFVGESSCYEVKPIDDIRFLSFIQPTDGYRYRVLNNSTGPKLRLYPAPRLSGTEMLTLHYLRQAKTFTTGSDTLDVPEAKGFIKQYVLDRVANKERMTPDAEESPALTRKRQRLIESLSTMREDDNNEIQPDLSHYAMSIGAGDEIQ